MFTDETVIYTGSDYTYRFAPNNKLEGKVSDVMIFDIFESVGENTDDS